jgi:hypothetical protein
MCQHDSEFSVTMVKLNRRLVLMSAKVHLDGVREAAEKGYDRLS